MHFGLDTLYVDVSSNMRRGTLDTGRQTLLRAVLVLKEKQLYLASHFVSDSAFTNKGRSVVVGCKS